MSKSNRLQRAMGQRCPYCGNTMRGTYQRRNCAPTRDHIVPRAAGGGPIVICCRKCNGDKADLALDEWVSVLEHNRDWRAPRVAALVADLASGRRRLCTAEELTLPEFAIGICDGALA